MTVLNALHSGCATSKMHLVLGWKINTGDRRQHQFQKGTFSLIEDRGLVKMMPCTDSVKAEWDFFVELNKKKKKNKKSTT
uniref:Uncharacterized protein n=1 Tax=Anguilla anguilla TaxID=7936 RepID=A0A0E9RW71_ANGAN